MRALRDAMSARATAIHCFWRSALYGRRAAAGDEREGPADGYLDTLDMLAKHGPTALAVRAREAHAQIVCALRNKGDQSCKTRSSY
jgi:hypothetical protein